MLVMALIFGVALANAQEPVYTRVEQSAEFPGGISAFYQFLSKNIHIPAEAKGADKPLRVFLTFVVEKDGTLSDIKIMRGAGYGCDEEAVRVIKLSPKWNPGKQDGKPVRQQYTIPVVFKTT